MSSSKDWKELLEPLASYGPAGIFFAVAIHDAIQWVRGDESLRTVLVFTGLGFLTALLSKVFKLVIEKLEEPIADWIVKKLQSFYGSIVRLLEVIGRKLSFQFKGKYYRSLIYACRDFRAQGLKIKCPFALDLEKVFVPLRVKPESVGEISPNLIRSGSESSGLSIWDFLADSRTHRQFRSLAIIGAPGSAKTTLLEHLTLTYAKNRQCRKHCQAPKLNRA